jgi:uncharacterized delta-60 repeat protein
VALQPDGMIVVAGKIRIDAEEDIAVARYRSNGSIDTTFGLAGLVTTDFGLRDEARAVALQQDLKIIVAGYSEGGLSDKDFVAARYNSDGSLDTTFGAGGKVTIDFFGRSDEAYSLAIQSDGKIVIAGEADRSGAGDDSDDFGLVRLTSNGSLDGSFGIDGKVVTDFSGGKDEARGVAVLSDNSILAAGYASSGGPASDFALARFSAAGNLDPSFGLGGMTTTDFFSNADGASALAIQPDGKVVAAGYSTGSFTGRDFAVARYRDDEAAPDFSLVFNPAEINAPRGTKVRVTINIVRTGGFTSAVTITPPDITPPGIVVKFPEPITTDGSTASYKLKIKGKAAPGPHQLTFTGRSNSGLVRTATVTLLVQ